MFERRIKFLLILLALPALAVASRLVQLQVFNAGNYRNETKRMLELRPRTFPCSRGRILDSTGRLLAYDAPAWDVAVQYGAMVDDPAVRKRMAKLIGVPVRELDQARIDESWAAIAQLAARPTDELQREARRIVVAVQRIKQRVSEQRGVETLVQEEMQAHPIVSGLDQSQQVAARVALAKYPWIEITAGHKRVYEGGAAVGQVVGTLGRVSLEMLAQDPNADDPLAKFDMEDRVGVQGVEAVAESMLRGRRGQIHEDRLGQELSPPIKAQDGDDAQLTINMELQEAVYGICSRLSAGLGAAAVVLDIPTRNVLAMVSYPAVDPNDPADITRIDPDDPRRPFLFRAVRGNYNPGSIVKPMILAAGLADKKVRKQDTVNCVGHLFPDYPDRWRCEGTHQNVGAVGAVQQSCNVYFYRLGQQLGVPREVYWMRQFGLGQASGTGLVEEFRGRLPTTVKDGEARQAGIGQSETELTPIQAANLIATVANGVYKPVTLWANDPTPHPPGTRLPVSAEDWKTVREGLYDVVNVPQGTAYRTLQSKGISFGKYVMLGKTGSAEGWAPESIYLVRHPDGRREEIRALNAPSLLRKHPNVQIESQRRPPEYDQTHSWFVAYLAPRGRHVDPVGPGPASVAVAVIVEYAGHGGLIAAPVAAEILQSYLIMAERPAEPNQAGEGQ